MKETTEGAAGTAGGDPLEPQELQETTAGAAGTVGTAGDDPLEPQELKEMRAGDAGTAGTAAPNPPDTIRPTRKEACDTSLKLHWKGPFRRHERLRVYSWGGIHQS